MSRYDSDDLRRVSPDLRAGGGVPRAGAFQVGGLRGLGGPAEAARLARRRARRGPAAGHHGAPDRGARPGERAAYIRRADSVTYVCPWQTRLRCLLSYGRMLSTAGLALPGVVPARDDHETMTDLARVTEEELPGAATRLYILASVWTVPLAWFVPFAAAERWLALGPGAKHPAGPQAASATRALLYTTPMSRARRRVARALAALRSLPPGFAGAVWDPVRAETELGEVGRWLEEFHPYSLVEL